MIKSLITSIFLVLCISSEIQAQDNVFISRGFWKSNPTITQIKEATNSTNNPIALNENAFDAVVYALLENVNDDAIKYLLSLEGNSVTKRTHDSRTYLFWAAYKGNVSIMKHLLDKGARVDVRDSKGNTPVTFSASTGQTNQEVYNLFEKQGVVLTNELNKYGVNTLLLIAPFLENESELTYFLNKGFKLNETDPLGNNIFNYAAKNGTISFLKLLLSKGVSPKVVNTKGGNAMLYASQGTRSTENTLETYQFLKSVGVVVNVVGDNGKNPLHAIAYKTKNTSIIDFFIENGVDVNLKDDDGNFPFGNAASSNNLAIVKTLFDHVKNINQVDGKGRSPLALAIQRNDVDVVKFLIENGADINVIDTDGNTLTYYLLNVFKAKNQESFNDKLALLKSKGLELHLPQAGKNTLVHLAAQKNDIELINRILDFNIDLNAKNDQGYTALHISAMKSTSNEILKFLIAKGADTTITTEFGETAFDLANENELLQQKNVQLNFLK